MTYTWSLCDFALALGIVVLAGRTSRGILAEPALCRYSLPYRTHDRGARRQTSDRDSTLSVCTTKEWQSTRVAASRPSALAMVAPHPEKAIAKLRLTLPPGTPYLLCHNPVVRPEPAGKRACNRPPNVVYFANNLRVTSVLPNVWRYRAVAQCARVQAAGWSIVLSRTTGHRSWT